MAVDWATITPLITAGVSAAGQVAAARQAGRQAQAGAQVPVDQLNQSAYQTDISTKQRGLDAQDAARLARALGMLQEQAAARKAPGERASNSVRGDVLANAQDATFSGSSRIPKFEFGGGLRPSMFSSSTRELGRNMSREALVDQLKGPSTPFADLPEADYSGVLDAPGAPRGTALPEGSRLDSVLQAIGQYGGLAAGVMNAGNTPPAAAAPTAPVAPGSNGMNAIPWGNVAQPAPPPAPQPMLAGRTIGNGTTIPRY
jgi:hypothetical protein